CRGACVTRSSASKVNAGSGTSDEMLTMAKSCVTSGCDESLTSSSMNSNHAGAMPLIEFSAGMTYENAVAASFPAVRMQASCGELQSWRCACTVYCGVATRSCVSIVPFRTAQVRM